MLAAGVVVLAAVGDALALSAVVGSDVAALDGFASERVTCPAGDSTVGGGIHPWSVQLMSVTSAAPVFDDGGDGQRLLQTENGVQPAPIGWQAAARNDDSPDGTVKVAAICQAPADVMAVVGSTSAAIGAHDVRRILCPGGRVAIGGGIDLAHAIAMSVTSSGPVFDDGGDGASLMQTGDGVQPAPIGWEGGGRNDSSPATTIKVAAVCQPRSDLFAVVASDVATAGSFAAERVLCPAGNVAIGGGVDLQNPETMTVTQSAPFFPDENEGLHLIAMADGPQPAPVGWAASVRNDGPFAAGMKVAVLCVPEPGLALLSSAAWGTLGIAAMRRARRGAARLR